MYMIPPEFCHQRRRACLWSARLPLFAHAAPPRPTGLQMSSRSNGNESNGSNGSNDNNRQRAAAVSCLRQWA